MKWLSRRLLTGPYLTLALSEKEFHQAMSAFKVPMADRSRWIRNDNSDATCHILTHPERGMACVVALRVRGEINGVQIAALLVHEAVHVFQQYCQSIGEANPSPEFEAYAIQNITQELMQSYADRREKGTAP